MTHWKIPLYKAYVEKDDFSNIKKIIERKMYWAIGPEIEKFEKDLSHFCGVKYSVTFNSGTSALHASLLALKILRGSEILVPSFTFISTANAPLMINSVPKFVDIEKERLGMDPLEINSSISKKTSAVIPIHFAGLPCKIDKIKEITDDSKLFLIEDAAEALGSRIKNRLVGTFGDLAIFSFAGNKVLTTGEGGAVITNSKKYYERLKLIRSHGRKEIQNYFSSSDKPNYIDMGYNWRVSSITAGLGITQLKKIKKIINLRRKHAKYYSKQLNNLQDVETIPEPKEIFHTYQFYSILLPNSKIRSQLISFLTKQGIMSKVFFYPVHKTPFYKKFKVAKSKKLSITETISEKILSLPMYPDLRKEEINFVCNSIKSYFDKYR